MKFKNFLINSLRIIIILASLYSIIAPLFIDWFYLCSPLNAYTFIAAFMTFGCSIWIARLFYLPALFPIAGVIIGIKNKPINKLLFRILTYPVSIFSIVVYAIMLIVLYDPTSITEIIVIGDLTCENALLVAIFILDRLSFKKSKEVQEVIEEAP